jgi:hypothetical protein
VFGVNGGKEVGLLINERIMSCFRGVSSSSSLLDVRGCLSSPNGRFADPRVDEQREIRTERAKKHEEKKIEKQRANN